MGDTVASMLQQTTQRADVLSRALGALRSWGSADTEGSLFWASDLMMFGRKKKAVLVWCESGPEDLR